MDGCSHAHTHKKVLVFYILHICVVLTLFCRQSIVSTYLIQERKGNKKSIVHSHSVDPQKLCVGVKYYIVHMY